MATERKAKISQSYAEKRQWDFDFNPDLETNVTVVSATALHIPPSGSAVTPTVGTIVANVVPVRLDTVTQVLGEHLLVCTATLSDGEISVMKLTIEVIV